MKLTELVSPRLPPCLEKAERISEAVRLRLSVRASTMMAHRTGAITLVAHFLVIGVALAAGAALDRPLDRVLRHIRLRAPPGRRRAAADSSPGRAGRSSRGTVSSRIDLGEDLGALRVLRTLAVHDVLEL